MLKIIFKIDKNQDAKNWRRVACMQNLPYGLAKVKNKNKKLKDFSAEEMKKLQINKHQLEKYFDKNGSTIFSSIEKLTKKPINSDTFYASFTTAGLIPYDISDSWFMIPAEKNIKKQITVIIHELLHLQIIHNHFKYCLRKGLNKYQFSELNEIITSVLISSILNKLNLPKEKIYPKYKKIVEELYISWIKDKNFNELFYKTIKILKIKIFVK